MDYDQNAPRQVLCDWITASGGVAAAFDFPTKGILQEAVRYSTVLLRRLTHVALHASSPSAWAA